MKKLITVLFVSIIYVECVASFEFIGPDARERKAKFMDKINALWNRYTLDGEEVPEVAATTFGEGGTKIRGKYMKTINDRTLEAYQGIRFAKAGRFQQPDPEDQYWDSEYLVADHIGEMCPQMGMLSGQPNAGDEDCLYLNVYVPEHSSPELLPVMVFIYGGAFTSGDSSLYLPTKLLDHDVILVTMHYRLGTLGFFYMGTDEAPGNYALYDQISALQWVQNHILDFGGDKSKVTVFGESAGSVSASYMQIIPQAKGLMRGIISESGSTIDVWSLDQDPMYASEFIAKEVDCYDQVEEEILIQCMKTVPVYKLVNATSHLVATDRANALMGFRGVSPVIQSDQVKNRLIEKHPVKYYEDRDTNDVPHMLGTNKQEGSFVAALMYLAYLVPNDLDNNTSYLKEQMLPDIIKSIGVYDISNALAESCGLQYCPDVDLSNFNEESSYCVIDMTGALYLKAGSWETANLMSYYDNATVYYYSFDFKSDDSMFDWIVGDGVPFEPGVTHADELMYLFSMPAVMEDQQIITMDRMTLLWTNFATYLDPTPEVNKAKWSELDLPKWIPYKFEDTYFLLMRDNFVMQKDFVLRWTITIDEIKNGGVEMTDEPIVTEMPISTPSGSSSPTPSGSISPTPSGSSSPTPSGSSSPTPSGSSTPSTTPHDIDDDDIMERYEEIERQANAYMTGMIAFIVAFCVADIIGIYLFFSK